MKNKLLTKLIVLCILLITDVSHADKYHYINENQLCDAIFWAEGGYNTNYPYGIRSVYCADQESCRMVCINTIRNNKRRYESYGHEDYSEYLYFLASRYAPFGAQNDPEGLNQNWLNNVLWFLDNPKEIR